MLFVVVGFLLWTVLLSAGGSECQLVFTSQSTTCVSVSVWTHRLGQILAYLRIIRLLTGKTMTNLAVIVLATSEMLLPLFGQSVFCAHTWNTSKAFAQKRNEGREAMAIAEKGSLCVWDAPFTIWSDSYPPGCFSKSWLAYAPTQGLTWLRHNEIVEQQWLPVVGSWSKQHPDPHWAHQQLKLGQARSQTCSLQLSVSCYGQFSWVLGGGWVPTDLTRA